MRGRVLTFTGTAAKADLFGSAGRGRTAPVETTLATRQSLDLRVGSCDRPLTNGYARPRLLDRVVSSQLVVGTTKVPFGCQRPGEGLQQMSRRSTGYVGVWAEVQRQQQRQLEAEARQRRQEAQQARAYQRRAAQNHREYRQADALRRTEELDAQVASLQGLLASGCHAPAFRASSLMRPEDVQPFAPGPLAHPVPMPDFNQYQTQSGWTASRRAQAQAEARARFERDWHAAQAAEAHRQQQLASYQREYHQWADARLADVRAAQRRRRRDYRRRQAPRPRLRGRVLLRRSLRLDRVARRFPASGGCRLRLGSPTVGAGLGVARLRRRP